MKRKRTLTVGRRLWKALIGLIFLSVLSAPALAQPDLRGFLSGPYVVIGKRPDSNETYSGYMYLKEAPARLRVVRVINDQETLGTGVIVKAAGGDVNVLRVRFVENGKSFEAIYLVEGDLDNYARLTGYVYLKDGSTKRVGLEALFADKGQLVRK